MKQFFLYVTLVLIFGMLLLNNCRNVHAANFSAGKDKTKSDMLIASGRASLEAGRMDEAHKFLERAQNTDHKYAPVYVLAGDIALAEHNVGEACSAYEQAIYFDPDCEEAYLKYAAAYAPVNPALSIDMLLRLKELHSDYLPAEQYLAHLYYTTGDYRKAVSSFKRFIDSPSVTTPDLTDYAMALFLLKDYAGSLAVIYRALEQAPDDVVLRRLAMYDAYELKMYDDGIQAADRFFSTPAIDTACVYLDYLYYGRLLSANHHLDKAIEHYRKALLMEPSKREIWMELSDTQERMQDYSGAIESFNHYLKTDKDVEAQDLFQLGRLYYYDASALVDSLPEISLQKQGELIHADSLFAIVAERVPDSYLGNFWRARTNSLLDPETTGGLAKPYYEAALSILENKSDASIALLVECDSYLGYYYYVKNDFPQSRVYWNKILMIDPDNKTAQKALDGIR